MHLLVHSTSMQEMQPLRCLPYFALMHTSPFRSPVCSTSTQQEALDPNLRYDDLQQVFKATDTQTAEVVAIKQMSLAGITSDNLQAVVGEIELLKNLRHKNIVKYIGSFKTKTHLSIILEYMEKGSLADVIRPSKFGAFPESLAAVYIAQVIHIAQAALPVPLTTCEHACQCS